MGAGVRKSIKLLSLALLIASVTLLILKAYSPKIYIEAEAGTDYDSWQAFWGKEKHAPELSIPGEKLPSSIPGPLDVWGGSKSRSIILHFNLAPGSYMLKLTNHDAHEAAPPALSFKLNDEKKAVKKLPPGKGLPPPYETENPALTIQLPVSLTQEENTLKISTEEGSWIAPARLEMQGKKQFALSNLGLNFIAKPFPFGFIAVLFLGFLLLNALGPEKKTHAKIIITMFAGVSLYIMFSAHRESIIPINADYERSLVLFGGDEPAYVMTGQAIARGDWLDVKETHEKKLYLAYWNRSMTTFPSFTRDWYMERGVNPWIDRSSWWGDKQILSRPPLLPFIISPLGLSHGNPRWKSAFILTIFASLSAALVFYFTADEKRTGIRGLQAITLTLCMGAVPIAYYTTVIFPEIIGGCLLLATLALIGSGKKTAGIMLMFIALWSTQRVLAGIALATAFIFYTAAKRRDRRAVALLVSGWAVYFFYHFFIWGLPFIPNIHPESRMDFSLLPLGMARFFMARDVGLFFLSPVSLIGLAAGVYLIIKERGGIDIIWGLLLAGLVIPVACFPDYRAGSCPAGRFQVIAACAMIFPLLRLFSLKAEKNKPLPVLFLPAAAFGAAGFAMSIILVSRPHFWFRQYHPLFGFERLQPYYNLLPDMSSPGWALKAALWLASFLILAGLLEQIAGIYNRKAGKRFDRQRKICLNAKK